MLRYYLLGGDIAAPSGLYARLCHAFLVSFFFSLFSIAERTFISRSAGPIFAIFSPNESCRWSIWTSIFRYLKEQNGKLPSFVAVSFWNRMGCHYLYVRINIINDASIYLCKNFVKFGPVTPELTELICQLWTSGTTQQTQVLPKRWQITPKSAWFCSRDPFLYAQLCRNKKLCYGRGIKRCACLYRKTLANMNLTSPWHTPKVVTVAAIIWPYDISLPICGLLFQRLYLWPFSAHYHFWSERDCHWPWELLYFWQKSLNYKSRDLSNFCLNIP